MGESLRVAGQILTGLALGITALACVSVLRHASTSSPVAAAGPPRGESSSSGVDAVVRNAAAAPDARDAPAPEQSPSMQATSEAGIVLLDQGSPIELMTESYRASGSNAVFATDLLQRHRQIKDSADDPSWSRDAERKLWDMIALEPEVRAFQVASIVCRTSGCEIQVFANSGEAADAWNGLISKFKQAIPFGVLTSSHASGAGGRTMYVVFLLRNASAGEGSR